MITCVDGIISCGKSTLINSFKKDHPEFYYVDEPLEQFTHFTTHQGSIISPLDIVYEDSTNATAFQLYVLDVFEDILQKVTEPFLKGEQPIIYDRCLLSAHVFTWTLKKLGSIPSFAWEYWMKKFQNIKAKYSHATPDQIFFVQTDVKTCLTRMCMRGRDMEVKYKNMEVYQNTLLESYNEILPLYDNVRIVKSYDSTISGRVSELESIIL